MHGKLIASRVAAPTTGYRICPTCGLRVDVVDVGERQGLRYDFPAWDGLCQYPYLGGPSACLSMQQQHSVARKTGTGKR